MNSPALRLSVPPSFHPGILIPLVIAACLYFAGTRALWRSAGSNHGVRHWQAAAFGLGWITLLIALVSPLDQMGEELFSAHMAQHELLMAVAAPLLVLGRPIVVWLWALPIAWRRRLGAWAGVAPVRKSWAFITLPLVAWAVHALAIWIWHVPRLFQATLSSELVHAAQHLSFLGSALLFWWSLLQIRDGRLGRPVAVLYLFTTAVHTSLLGAILAFSSRVWYPIYGATTAHWGLTPLEDQQLAGLIMWVPAGLTYLAAALAITATWLQEPARRMVPPRAVLRILPVLILGIVMSGCKRGSAMTGQAAAQLTGGNPHRGELAIRHYGCAACHTIPGVPGANSNVGPALAGMSGRPYIAGVLTNSPTNLVRWIQHPQQVDPLTAMPDVGLSQTDARDIASYLYTLK